MVKHRIIKRTIILSGVACICFLLISLANRMGTDSYMKKTAEADCRFKNGNAMEKPIISGKGQKSAGRSA